MKKKNAFLTLILLTISLLCILPVGCSGGAAQTEQTREERIEADKARSQREMDENRSGGQ